MKDCSYLIPKGKPIPEENLLKIADIVEPYIIRGEKIRDIMKMCKIGQKTIKKIIQLKGLKSRDKTTPKNIINKIKSIYIKTKDINLVIKETGLDRSVIYKYLRRFNIETKIKKISKRDIDAKEEKKLSNGRYIVKVKCSYCKEYYWVEKSYITKAKRTNKKRICDNCNRNSDFISNRPISKKNTSGYIGVSVCKKKDTIYGYKSVIVYKKCIVMSNLYKDEMLNDKTLIQAAVDRDIFIIEKILPHRRNFSDKELIANMEYLAHEQLDIIKEKLDK